LPVIARSMKRDQAISEGATALFGEKYGDDVRTIAISTIEKEDQTQQNFSYELCGGTHLSHTGIIGPFLILSEGSAAAGIRRIEAVTGRVSDKIIRGRIKGIEQVAKILSTSPEKVVEKTTNLLNELNNAHKQISDFKAKIDFQEFDSLMSNIPEINGIPVLTAKFEDTEVNTLRNLCDHFRQKNKKGILVLGTIIKNRPLVMAAVTEDLTKKGINAGDLVNHLAQTLGGSGGGRPTLAQAGGKDPLKLEEALEQVQNYVESHLKG